MGRLDSSNKRLLIIATICGFIYSMVVVFGRQIYLYGNFQNAFAGALATCKTFAFLLLIMLVVAAVLFFVFRGLLKITKDGSSFEVNSLKSFWNMSWCKLWLINWAILFICWLPCYLAYFPGSQSYDAPEQICMIEGVFPATTHQPPIHTIVMGWTMSLGESFGIEPIIIYTVAQMIIMAAIFSYFLVFLMKHFARKTWEIVLLYLFFAVNPILPLMAVQPTKDVLFACFFTLCTLIIYEIVTGLEDIKIYKYVLFSVFLALTALFRNNALYAILLACVIMIIFVKMKRMTKVKTAAAVALALVIIHFVNVYTCDVLGYEKVDDKVEMSAVPMSQLALVFAENPASITEEEWQQLSFYIKDGSFLVQAYNPRFYDPIKDALYKTNLQDEYGGFLKIWAKLLKEHPVQYLRAFLNLNIPYWYPFADTIDPYSDRMYIETYIGVSPYQFERNSKIPWLMEIYEKIADYSMLDKPLVRILFAINTPIWVMLLGIAFLIVKKDYKKIIVFMPSLFLWGTYLLGPVSNFRYIYPIFVLYPLFAAMVLHKDTAEIQ